MPIMKHWISRAFQGMSKLLLLQRYNFIVCEEYITTYRECTVSCGTLTKAESEYRIMDLQVII